MQCQLYACGDTSWRRGQAPKHGYSYSNSPCTKTAMQIKSPTGQDAFRPILHLISYAGVTGRWGPSKIIATTQAIVIITCCRSAHTYTTSNVSSLVLSLVNKRKSKLSALTDILFTSSHNLMVHSSCAAVCKMQARKCLVSPPDLIWCVHHFQYNTCDTESTLHWGWFGVWD